MPERRENCKKQIDSNTNHNRMPKRRENSGILLWLVLLTICFLQFSLLSGILLGLVLLTISFLQFSLLSGILLWLVLLSICFLQFSLLSGILLWNRRAERRENCKKQIVSNTNHNRMPERRENCKNK
jgi:membrane protein implicated in regulation of membrane protease activity